MEILDADGKPVVQGVKEGQAQTQPNGTAATSSVQEPVLPPPPITEETREFKYSGGVFQCKFCEVFRTTIREKMMAHIRKDHLAEPVAPPATPPETPTLEGLQEQGKEPPVDSFVCEVCKKPFKSDVGLKTHVSKMHKDQTPAG
jgi:hypothetical protein